MSKLVDETIVKEEIKIKGRIFVFWKTFIPVFLIIFILLVLFIYVLERDVKLALLVAAILSFLLAIAFTSIIKWIKEAHLKQKKETKREIGSVIGVIVFLLSFIIGYYLGIVYFLLIALGYLGYLFSGWYIKRKKVSSTVINIICWSNIITWFLPILGISTSIASLRFAKFMNNKTYLILGIFGISLSVINGILGIYLKLLG